MRRAGLMTLVMLLVTVPAVLVLFLAKWPSDAPVSVTPTTFFLPPMHDKTWKNFQPQLPANQEQSLPEPLVEPLPTPPRLLHVHQIPAQLDPTDDAVLATTIDTRFRHLGPVLARAMSPCGNRIAAVCEAEGVIREWDVCSGEEVRQFKLPDEEDGTAEAGFIPCLIYRAEQKQLLYRSTRGRITNFSTDDGRVVNTFRHDYREAVRNSSRVPMSDDGQFVMMRIDDGQQGVFDTGTGAELYRTPKSKVSDITWAQFSPDNKYVVMIGFQCVCVIDWKNNAKPLLLKPKYKIKETGYHQDKLVMWIDDNRFVVQVEEDRAMGHRCELYDARTGQTQLLPHNYPDDVDHVLGVQNGVVYGVSYSNKSLPLDPLTLNIITGPVKPWTPTLVERMQERNDHNMLGYYHDNWLAAPTCWLSTPKELARSSSYDQTVHQLVKPDGTLTELIEMTAAQNEGIWQTSPQMVDTPKGRFVLTDMGISDSLYTFPDYQHAQRLPTEHPARQGGRQIFLGKTPTGTVWYSASLYLPKQQKDIFTTYEVAVPSGEVLQKREGHYRLSRDGRWLAQLIYPNERWEISSVKPGSKAQLEENFDTLPFIKQNTRNISCGTGLFGKTQSVDRRPDDFFVTTDGRVFGIRNGIGDETPRTTITVRHVDHPDWKHLTHYQLPGTGTINDQYEVSFHPNERLLFVTLQNQKSIESELRCYELATLSEVFRYRHPRGVSSVKFDRSGQKMLLNHKDDAQSVYDFAKFFARQLKPADAKHWLSEDPALAIPAMRALAKQADAVDVVQRALKQPKPDIAADLLALGDANFRSREAATERLRLLGDAIATELQAALDTTSQPEVHDRLQSLVRAAVPRYGLTRQQFRELRAKEVLELVGTPEAKKLLNEWK